MREVKIRWKRKWMLIDDKGMAHQREAGDEDTVPVSTAKSLIVCGAAEEAQEQDVPTFSQPVFIVDDPVEEEAEEEPEDADEDNEDDEPEMDEWQ